MSSSIASLKHNITNRLLQRFPWVTAPFIVAAPMRVMTGPDLALAASKAGGLGFIGPGLKPEDTIKDLITARKLFDAARTTTLDSTIFDNTLPIGVGFQLWNGDIKTATRAVRDYRPCAAWLFAPREGQKELDEWTDALKQAQPEIHVWIQIGSLQEALDAANSTSRPDVLVVQGAEAGGHGTTEGAMGLMTLLPEIADAVHHLGLPLFAAGGIADGRGIAAALALGASGVVLGTRFLASTEARISKGYQQAIIQATDGAKQTVRTTLYNQLRGTHGWPAQYSPRGIINKSWHDHRAGVPFEELKRLHEDAMKAGESGWGPEGRLATYAGAGVGLVRSVEPAGVLIKHLQNEARDIMKTLPRL